MREAVALKGPLSGLEDGFRLSDLKLALEREFARERDAHRQVEEVAPGMIPTIRTLRREQDELRRWLEGLLMLSDVGLAPNASFARDRCRLLGRIRRHMRAEARLLQEAFLRDVGGD